MIRGFLEGQKPPLDQAVQEQSADYQISQAVGQLNAPTQSDRNIVQDLRTALAGQ